MADETIKITTIQLKRGYKDILDANLVGAKKPAQGEIIWEMDTSNAAGKWKIGDGVSDYKDLPYQASSEDWNTWLTTLTNIKNDAVNAKTDAVAAELKAEDAATKAEKANADAQEVPQKAVDAFNDELNRKMQFLTLDQFNALESLDAGTFYWVKYNKKVDTTP